jgi:competence protein ComEC
MAFLDLNWSALLPSISQSRIVELNASSFVLASDQGKILVYTKNIDRYNLLDEVKVTSFNDFEITPTTYGFVQKAYYRINNLIGYTDESMIVNHTTSGLLEFFGSGGLNRNTQFIKLSRAVLYQSDPLTDFIALISLGLLYTMIFKIGQFVLSFFMNDYLATLGMLIFFGLGAYCLAYPISLIRVMVSLLLNLIVKNGKDRLIGYLLFFIGYNVSALTSLAVLYPLLFMVFGAFKVKRINRWSSLGYFQIALLHQFSLFMILLYPYLRKLMMILVILIWIGMMIPLTTPLVLYYHQILQTITDVCQHLLIIRGSVSFSLLVVLVILMFLGYWAKRPKSWVYLIVLFLIPILSSPWAYQLTIISVGQGDAILLQAPFNQEVILIDTGKTSAYGQLTSFLNAQGISKIDTLIITHDDNDHSGNKDQLSANYHVMRSVTAPKDVNSNWFTLKSLKTGLTEPTDNQASLVYLLQLNGIRFLLMADADEAREIDLIRQYPDLKADILKVGHHGSATSTSAEFLSRIQVRMALISVGYNNYGHPSWLTLDRLKNQYVSVMTTRDEGDLMFVFIKGFTGLSTSLSKLKPLRLGF